MPTVYLGIGSNLGERQNNCLRAIELLKEKGIVLLRQSSMYETEPEGVKEQPSFINMAVEVKTDLCPRRLLEALKAIEKEIGRVETFRWGPRIIDLDILLYEDFILNEPDLKIPHPLMHKRGFVLKPLSEIAGDVRHPVLKKTVIELLRGSQPVS